MELKSLGLKHDGKFLKLYEALYKTSKGNEKKYELISRKNISLSEFGIKEKTDAVGMIIFNHDFSKILLQKEYRLACNNWVYNFPGGLIDEGENIEETTRRELEEETGLHLKRVLKFLPPAYTAVGISNELVITVIGVADGELRTGEYQSENEEIIPSWYSKTEVKELIENNAYMSLRTQSVLYMWLSKLF